jgi:hypothetical protein
MILYTNSSKKVYIKENKVSLLKEDVFASKRKGKNKIQLSYNKRTSDGITKNRGNLTPSELLNTGKMDQNNSDTYEVPLKGGIMSYNITSIRGTEIMHYFKNKYAKMEVDLNGDGQKEEYELFMEDPEYKEFFNQFYNKINTVVSHVTNNLYQKSNGKIKFSGVSIYPVPSSSNFNELVSKQLAKYVKLDGLNVISINQGLFKKDLSNLQKDQDFIKKNKDYYSSKMFKYGDDPTTHEQYLDKELANYGERENVRKIIKGLIKEYNILYDKLDSYYLQYRNSGGKNFPKTLASHYSNLNQKYQEILAALKQGRKRSIEADSMFQALKGTKSQVEARKTEDVWNIVKPFFRGRGIKPLVMHRLEPKDFQIKNLSNDIRMGIKNYFSSDPKIVMQELEKIKGTIFVIFDDNISGGATLSDICLQAKQLGIEYIIPITFGEMQKKYNLGIGKQINMPSKSGNFQNYS